MLWLCPLSPPARAARPSRPQLAVPAKGFRSTQISSVGAAVDPPCDGDRWDGLMSAPRDPWWQSRESGCQALSAGSHGCGTGQVTTAPGLALLHVGTAPRGRSGHPGCVCAQGCQSHLRALSHPKLAEVTVPSPGSPLCRASPPSCQPGADPQWGIPVPWLSLDKGQAPCHPFTEHNGDMTQCREQRELGKLKHWGPGSPPHCLLSQAALAMSLQLPAVIWGDTGAMQGQAPGTETLVTHRGHSSG